MEEQIIEKFKEVFEEPLNVKTITDAVICLMKIIEEFSNLHGNEKKEMLIRTINKIIDDTNVGEMDMILDNVLKNIIPIVIDRIVSIEKGELKIKKKYTCFSFC